MKKLAALLICAALLSACRQTTVPASSVTTENESVAPTAGTAASEPVPQTADIRVKTAELTEEKQHFLSLVDDGYTLLYDYTANGEAVSVELTCYELVGDALEVVNRLAIPAGRSGRIAASYDRMVEGFRLAVQTDEDVHNLKLENPDRSFPRDCACRGVTTSVDEECAYGGEIPLATQFAAWDDSMQNIEPNELWKHPEAYTGAKYRDVYLLTLNITPRK